MNEWILCSEKMPEDKTAVLASTEDGMFMLAYRIDGKWFFDDNKPIERTSYIPVAWMPLPKPYKN